MAVLFFDFKTKRNMRTNFSKNPKYKISKILPVGIFLLHVDE
jgi:hypothetical protein